MIPKDSDASKSLMGGGKANIAKLKGLRGDDFDRAYIDHEVTYHQAVLYAVDRTLIPNAKNTDLRETLLKFRPAFAAHLETAKHIQETMK